MKVISIVDDDYGIMFNNRRVSKDSVLNEHIIKMLDGGKLWLSLYSKQLFGDYENIEVNQEFGFAGKDDFCFVEDSEIVSYEDMVDEIYLYKWNRKYLLYTGVMLTSLCENNPCHIDVYILHSELTDKDIQRLKDCLYLGHGFRGPVGGNGPHWTIYLQCHSFLGGWPCPDPCDFDFWPDEK